METEYYQPNTTEKCLGCGNQLPDAFLDLGAMPLANSYIEPENKDKKEALYKLAVAYCPVCHLVQITHRVPPQNMFSDYLYFTSFSSSFLEHAETMAESLAARFSLGSNSLVMEVGSNDGYLLHFFQKKGVQVIGIEPAGNICRVANEKGIPTMEVFFGPDSINEILREKGQVDIIIGNNVLAHIPLINDFLLCVNKCLKPGGSAVFEFPYLKDFLEHTEFDTIYHEHVFYYSLTAIKILAERAGLSLYDVSRQDIHGGSIRVFLQKQNHHHIANSVEKMLTEEANYGITGRKLYDDFAERVERLKVGLVQLLKELKKSGKCIAAYGAAAKGSTLLNYAGIDHNLIDFVVDRSTYKQGKYMPGVHLPILPPSRLLEAMPDYTLLLAWNFADEIQWQQAEYHQKGGRFIIPVPELRVV
ncbi:MAG: class I SAM-dependent methyltransferase [Dehalococcoidia bacterium]